VVWGDLNTNFKGGTNNGGRSGVGIYLITQDTRCLAKELRELAEYEIKAKKLLLQVCIQAITPMK